ncbi:MAG: (2Fe-2S)-binding protein [Kordiimonadaceae bacterium]|jgi:aerobic-type carbon monoxide dehydrogenase small subunit (CoxS/CutS family)|nr:(2Fe-2S)-binding protein [Kordiimonadaceae bacterium]MBT6330412.1 (2Fe-2S)-binding protein [Kordiimonadaceae bacterium]
MQKKFSSDRYDPLSTERDALSRRNFIKGVIAAGTVAGAAGLVTGCSDGSDSSGGSAASSVERLITINVNGNSRPVDVLPNETLAQTLRNKLGLTGTKIGCDRGSCGACTVMIDGVTQNSCSILTHTVRGASVVTVEGVGGANGELHPVQQAMIEELAPQCGYCTPGQVVSGVSLLQRNPNPTRDEVRNALAGNLCRCGAYNNYINAIVKAAGSA